MIDTNLFDKVKINKKKEYGLFPFMDQKHLSQKVEYQLLHQYENMFL